MKAQQWLFVMLLFAAALQSMYYYPRLPETVASHFDPTFFVRLDVGSSGRLLHVYSCLAGTFISKFRRAL